MNRRELLRFITAAFALHGGRAFAGLKGVLSSRERLLLPTANRKRVTVHRLRCEYRENPLGIDIVRPRLSWILLADGRRGVRQTAYRIVVASSESLLADRVADLWDTGKISSDRSTQIQYNGAPLCSRLRCYWAVMIWDEMGRPSAWSASALWTVGLLKATDWNADWISVANWHHAKDDSQLPTPGYLRKHFHVDEEIERATAYVTAAGLYELRINGNRAGNHLLAPEWTNYHKRIQYETLDVTAMMKKGSNAIGAILGNGWYCGLWQHWPPRKGIYGKYPRFLLQLEIQYKNGSSQCVLSDNTWAGTTEGPIRFSGIYEGETYDARMEMLGWDEQGFAAEGWESAIVESPGDDFMVGRPVWQRNEPIREQHQLTAKAVSEPLPGVYVFDMGQNMVGWCRMRSELPEGVHITLLHNEMLNPDGTVYMGNLHAGHMSSGDRQTVRFISRGGKQTWEPHFTYMGFRFVEVRGLMEKPEREMLTGIVFHSSAAMTGSFTCSNPLVNRLVDNIQWSQRGNLMGVPTDCPSRDERCGYTGDAQFFMPTAVYNMDVAAFFSKWLVDLCEDSQREDGGFADQAPDFGAGSSQNVGWSDAGIICPYISYITYGDVRLLSDHYAAMKRNLEMLVSTSHGYTRGPDHVGNGDWLNLGGGATKAVIGTAYYAYVFQLMAEIAAVLGFAQDSIAFRERSEKIKLEFAETFIDARGVIAGSGQTAYALAFSMRLVPDKLFKKVAEQFAASIDAFQGHIATGFIGTPHLLKALHLAGRDDLATRLLLNDSFPSWLYEVKLGATTIWERWDGWTPEHGFQDAGMNSFNHYSLGSCGEYLFSVIGGISCATPGYKRVRIEPTWIDGLEHASAEYESIHGKIKCAWKRHLDLFILAVTIPANTFATVHLPTSDLASIVETGLPLSRVPGIRVSSTKGRVVSLDMGSGSYYFSFRPACNGYNCTQKSWAAENNSA